MTIKPGILSLAFVVLKDRIVVLGPGFGLDAKSLVLTLMCYGGPDTIDWSYILSDDGRVIHIPTNKQECCHWCWSLVVPTDKVVFLGHGCQKFSFRSCFGGDFWRAAKTGSRRCTPVTFGRQPAQVFT